MILLYYYSRFGLSSEWGIIFSLIFFSEKSRQQSVKYDSETLRVDQAYARNLLICRIMSMSAGGEDLGR